MSPRGFLEINGSDDEFIISGRTKSYLIFVIPIVLHVDLFVNYSLPHFILFCSNTRMSKKRSAAAVEETPVIAEGGNDMALEKVDNNMTRKPDFPAISAKDAFVSWLLLLILLVV